MRGTRRPPRAARIVFRRRRRSAPASSWRVWRLFRARHRRRPCAFGRMACVCACAFAFVFLPVFVGACVFVCVRSCVCRCLSASVRVRACVPCFVAAVVVLSPPQVLLPRHPRPHLSLRTFAHSLSLSLRLRTAPYRPRCFSVLCCFCFPPPLSISELSPWRRTSPCARPIVLRRCLLRYFALAWLLSLSLLPPHRGSLGPVLLLARFVQSTRILASTARPTTMRTTRCGGRPRSGGERLLKITRGDNNQATTGGGRAPTDEGGRKECVAGNAPPRSRHGNRISPGLASFAVVAAARSLGGFLGGSQNKS